MIHGEYAQKKEEYMERAPRVFCRIWRILIDKMLACHSKFLTKTKKNLDLWPSFKQDRMSKKPSYATVPFRPPKRVLEK